MANLGISFISMLWDILNSKTGNIGSVKYEPQKPMYDFDAADEQPLPRSLPEEQGVRSDWVSSLVMDLYCCRPAHMHQLTVIRHGTIIYEGGFDPYPSGLWHASYSMCKSFTGLAIGLLMDDGSVRPEDRVVDLLPEYKTLVRQIKFQRLTVKDLLIMSSGSSCNEIGAISGNDWIESFLDAPLKVQPGTEFDYNSMNSFMLSAIVSSVTGMSMFDFLKLRVFDPIGIHKIFWEKSPKGITKGGWGLFIRQEDAAKLGILFMNRGNWKGKQLVSSEWIDEATTPHNKTGNGNTPYYGYQLWLSDHVGGFAFNGMLGQNVYCYPDLDAVIVTNAGNSEIFQEGGMTGIIHGAVETMNPLDDPISPELLRTRAAQKRLRHIKRAVEGREKFTAEEIGRSNAGDFNDNHSPELISMPVSEADHIDTVPDQTSFRAISFKRRGWKAHSFRADETAGTRFCAADPWSAGHRSIQSSVTGFFSLLDGRIYEMKEKSVGLFPLIMQVIHNNFTKGISFLRFRVTEGEVFLELMEGSTVHILPVSFGRGIPAAIDMNGEKYLVSCKGRMAVNEDGLPVLVLRICFLEEATERGLKIVFRSKSDLLLQWDETPGNVIILDTLNYVNEGASGGNFIMNSVMRQLSPELQRRTIQSAVQPSVTAVHISEEDFARKIKDCLSGEEELPAQNTDAGSGNEIT